MADYEYPPEKRDSEVGFFSFKYEKQFKLSLPKLPPDQAVIYFALGGIIGLLILAIAVLIAVAKL